MSIAQFKENQVLSELCASVNGKICHIQHNCWHCRYNVTVFDYCERYLVARSIECTVPLFLREIPCHPCLQPKFLKQYGVAHRNHSCFLMKTFFPRLSLSQMKAQIYYQKAWNLSGEHVQVDKINGLESKMQQLSDEQLKNKTTEFRERLKKGTKLEDLLVEAFAVSRIWPHCDSDFTFCFQIKGSVWRINCFSKHSFLFSFNSPCQILMKRQF